jgi:hypothetical protein
MYDWRPAQAEISRIEKGRGRRLTPEQRERVKERSRWAQQAQLGQIDHVLLVLLLRWWFEHLGGGEAFEEWS